MLSMPSMQCNTTSTTFNRTAEEAEKQQSSKAAKAEAEAEAAASLSNVLFDIATCCIQNTKQAVSKNSAQRAKNV